MSHDAMKSDGELTSFPLRETHIIDEDYKIVSRDPQHQINILNPLRLPVKWISLHNGQTRVRTCLSFQHLRMST